MNLNCIFERLVLREACRSHPPMPNGRPRAMDDRRALHLMFKVLRSGMQWRELECEVNYTTVMRRMHAWSARGVFAHAYRSLLQTYKKLMPTMHYCVDSAYVKNMFSHECVGRNHTDRGRKALKLSAVVDQHGMPHGFCCHAGNRPDVTLQLEALQTLLDD